MEVWTACAIPSDSPPPSTRPKPFGSTRRATSSIWIAAYAFHIAQNQPFVDGNKRAAITAALVFLEINGVNTSRCPDDVFYDALIALAEKRLDKPGLAAVFRLHLSA